MTVPEVVSLLGDNFQAVMLPQVISILITLSPILLAIILFVIMWDIWVSYVRSKNFLSLKYTVLELRLPKETFKSPLAMESFLHVLHNTADGSYYSQYWKGETRPWYSLELISIEGQVKYMIWTEDRRKSGLTAALYAQFPGIEVYEREDYTKSVHFDPAKMRIWAAEFIFTKEDPYPIKTYVDYGLDKDPKEEFKVDPLVPVIEFLGSVRPNQQVWFQILIRAHKKEQKKPGHLFKKTDLWKDQAEELKNKIMIREADTKATKLDLKNPEDFTKLPRLSPGEQEIVEALDRSITKLPFDVGIRCLYIAPKDTFDTPFGIGGIISSWKQFNTEHLNGFKPNGDKWHVQFAGVPWEDYRNMRRDFQAKAALMAYKRRSYFYTPFEAKPLVLNTEELATIYHFPGSVAATPGLERVPSKKATAPSNLPI